MKPTDAELEILQVLWSKGPSTVRQVHDELTKTRDVGYTTTLKLMQIMQEKSILGRTEEARSHVYHVLIGEEETQKSLLDRFVETAFRGSATKLVIQALGQHKASREELDEIRALLNEQLNQNSPD
ncbi:BlaI/MecI/CopY family transcriptional regulator [Arsenicibacter rosenii]|uniref:Transcriptional regulator n=1 Tax=Arsenicibacter rosenii TaxID=1750698 RepID=A0A1S2VJI0_9BACT|nr:BlaI/MecI/CopY family transcriptional regulator [Arsenicibacter rosenii]OIN58883.1 transcriptional regulator [Arsenicibacter rosenii]